MPLDVLSLPACPALPLLSLRAWVHALHHLPARVVPDVLHGLVCRADAALRVHAALRAAGLPVLDVLHEPALPGPALQSAQIGKARDSVFWDPLNHSIS